MKKYIDILLDKPITTCVVIGVVTTSVVKIIKAVKKSNKVA